MSPLGRDGELSGSLDGQRRSLSAQHDVHAAIYGQREIKEPEVESCPSVSPDAEDIVKQRARHAAIANLLCLQSGRHRFTFEESGTNPRVWAAGAQTWRKGLVRAERASLGTSRADSPLDWPCLPHAA